MHPVSQAADIQERWTKASKGVVAIASLAILFDGFDLQVIGFVVPAIVRDWHIERARFAPLLVIGLLGMICGSLIAGYLGDRIGRRRALISSIFVFGSATLVSAFAQTLPVLEILRFVAAVGIGGALPNAATVTAEFTPPLRRAFAVMLTILCVPLGGALAGTIAAQLLPTHGWRAVLLVGGIAPLLVGVAMIFLLPETPGFLKQTGVTRVDRPEKRWADIFGNAQRWNTLPLWLAFFASASNVYLCFNWLPSLLAASGMNLAAASTGLAAYNYGGVIGVLGFSLLVQKVGSRRLALLATAGGIISALILMAVPLAGAVLPAALGLHGFFVNAVQTSLFALGVHIYPVRSRSTGVAVAASLGRVGGIVSSFTGAALIQLGSGQYFTVLASAMAVTFFAMFLLRNHIPPALSAD